MLDKFNNALSQNEFFSKDHQLLVAVSGGVDSMVLVSLLHQLKFNIRLAHMNFQLRGIESNADEAFVMKWAKKNKIQLFTQKVDLEKTAGSSIQMMAREIRYNWFWELMKLHHFDFLLTAHHADDLAETILYNLSKGTGIAGLRGMLPANGQHIRPLLSFTKSEIVLHAKENQISWRDDSSNATDKYARNKLRHRVIPVLQEINPSFLQNLNLTHERFIATEAILKEKVENISKKYSSSISENFKIKMDWFKNPKIDIIVLNEILQPFGFTYRQAKEIAQSFHSNSGIRFYAASYECLVDRNTLMIRKITDHFPVNEIIETSGFEIQLSRGKLTGNIYPKSKIIFDYSDNRAYLDAKRIKFPICIRNWKAGDYFHPYGMQNRKKISDYLIDVKMPVMEKENQLVVISNHEICWLLNQRIDDRFKITTETNEILLLEYQPLKG